LWLASAPHAPRDALRASWRAGERPPVPTCRTRMKPPPATPRATPRPRALS